MIAHELAHIRRYDLLRSLSLRQEGRLTDESLQSISKLNELESLTDRSLEHLSQIKTLTRLDLYGSGQPGVAPGRNFKCARVRTSSVGDPFSSGLVPVNTGMRQSGNKSPCAPVRGS